MSNEQAKPVLVPTAAEARVLEALRALTDGVRVPISNVHPMSFRSGMHWNGVPKKADELSADEKRQLYFASIGWSHPRAW
jgi:hypothetical protein